MTPKLSNLKIALGYLNENSDSCFRFNNPKQCSNWIILVSFCSSHRVIKIATMFISWQFKKAIKNSKKFVYYNEKHEQFQTQLSRKLQRFRKCRKNKKYSIFHDLSKYIIFHMFVTYWTGPLSFIVKIHDLKTFLTQSNFTKIT